MTVSTDITGQVFGDLTVLELATKDRRNQTIWKCKCVCGLTPSVRRNDLVMGRSKSCGCAKRRRYLENKAKGGKS